MYTDRTEDRRSIAFFVVRLKGCRPLTIKPKHSDACRLLQDLLEGTVDGRAHRGALVEVDGGNGALADALGGELEFL